MGWWKRAQMQNFEDRNQFNMVAHRLKDFADSLKYAEKLIFQTARGARQMVAQITQHKTLSSFPLVKELLEKADQAALDSPHKFASFCAEAADLLLIEVDDIEEKRNRFLYGDEENSRKGWIVNE